MFYAYILQSLSQPTELYRGHTADLKQRLAEHNAGKCLHTAKLQPGIKLGMNENEKVIRVASVMKSGVFVSTT